MKALSFFLTWTLIVSAEGSSKIKVKPATSESLSIILKGSDSLHSNLTETQKENQQKVKTDAMQLLQLVKVATRTARATEPAENLLHLEKILISTEGHLKDFLNVAESDIDRKMMYLREFYQQVTQLARQYDVPHRYHIFFCQKSNTKYVWLQKSNKRKNPFDTDGSLKNCGLIVK